MILKSMLGFMERVLNIVVINSFVGVRIGFYSIFFFFKCNSSSIFFFILEYIWSVKFDIIILYYFLLFLIKM